jgi:hypothetical protein
LVDFLYARSDKLHSFTVVWEYSPMVNSSSIPAGLSGNRITDTVSGQLSRLARLGMDIDLRNNYVAIWYLSDIFHPTMISFFHLCLVVAEICIALWAGRDVVRSVHKSDCDIQIHVFSLYLVC